MQFFRKSSEPALRHLLTVSDTQGVQTFILDASMYSIGRDATNAIVIHAEGVSRQHAILLRTPTSEKQYRYVLQDGNLEGKPSARGTMVNGVPAKKYTLKDGDTIDLGGKATLSYRTVLLSDQELENKVTVPEYRKLKGNILTAAQTVQIEDVEQTVADPPTVFVESSRPTKPPTKAVHPQLKQEIDRFKECYETVVKEMGNLALSPAEYTLIATAIYQNCREQKSN